MSPSPPAQERLPWPAHGPRHPRGRSGVFQATWGALSSDSLFAPRSGRRSPSGAVNSLPRVFASRVSAPGGVSLPPCPLWLSPGFSGQGRSPSLPLSAGAAGVCVGGLALASTPALSRGALLSLAQVSNALAPAPSRPSVGPSPLGPSLPTPSPRGREAPPETGAEAAGPDASHANPPPPTHCPGTLGVPARFSSPLPLSKSVQVLGVCGGGRARLVDRGTPVAVKHAPLPSTEWLRPDGGSATPGARTRGDGGRSVPDRQGQLVSGEEGSCAPRPSLSPPLFPLLSVGPPAQARRSPRSAAEFPQRSPPATPTWRGRGRGAGPGRRGGKFPAPSPGPTPANPLISQRRPPAAPRAWGEASAGAWEGGGGGRGGGGGWPGPSGPAPPTTLAPQSSLPTSPRALTRPFSRDGPVPAPQTGWLGADSSKAKVREAVTRPAET